MASLNTLRTRGGVVISVVIGIALLAFLLGDFVPRGCSEQNVGVINHTKISYVEYANKVDNYTIVMQGMSGKESLSSDEQDQVRDMAWEALIIENSYKPGLEKLGLTTSNEEQEDMVNGVYPSSVLTSTFANPQTGVYDAAILHQFIANKNIDQSGRLRVVWNYLEEQVKYQRTMDKYVTLVSKGMQVSDLEIEFGVAAANRVLDARVVSAKYSSVADSLATVTSGDIKRYYDAHKGKFKQTPSREVEYVVFDLIPSVTDMEDAEKEINSIAEEFAMSDSPMQYAMLNSHVSTNSRYQSLSRIDSDISAAVMGKPEAMYGPVLSGYTYTLAREGESKMMPDSVGARHILLQPGKRELADSLMNAIKKGADFVALVSEFTDEPDGASRGGDLGVFAPEQIPALSEDLITHNKGDVFVVEATYGIHVVEMTYKLPMVKKVQIAMIQYKIEPSSATDQDVYGEASRFLSSAQGSHDNFRKATSELGVEQRVARIKNSDRNVMGINDSRELVRWAFNSKKDDVSGIISIDGNYVVAALARVQDEDMMSVKDAEDQIMPILKRERKAEILTKNMGELATLEEVSSNFSSEIMEVLNVSQGAFYLEGVGVEQQLIGAITATTQIGKLSKPVVGQSGLFLFDVTEIRVEDNATYESEQIRLESASTNYITGRLNESMRERSNVVDNRVKFF